MSPLLIVAYQNEWFFVILPVALHEGAVQKVQEVLVGFVAPVVLVRQDPRTAVNLHEP